MNLLPIIRMGDPVLRLVAEPVADPACPLIGALAEAMVEAMVAAPGVGLAAPQAASEPIRAVALVNPEFEPLDDATEPGWEGCLSVPDMRGVVPRFTRIGYRGWLVDGRRVEGEASGFQARILQHEIDHLDGITYLDRMTDLTTLGYAPEIAAAVRAADGQS